MTVAEWQSSTTPTTEKRRTPESMLTNLKGGDNFTSTPDYGEDIEKTLAFKGKRNYIVGSSTLINIEYLAPAEAKMVPVDSVMRVTSAFVGSFSGLAFVANILSGVVILQPFICVLFIVASIGFYGISYAKR
jgi:hypothetical protein